MRFLGCGFFFFLSDLKKERVIIDFSKLKMPLAFFLFGILGGTETLTKGLRVFLFILESLQSIDGSGLLGVMSNEKGFLPATAFTLATL